MWLYIIIDIHVYVTVIFTGADSSLNISCTGVDIPTLLDGILQLLPLDTYVKCPVSK